MRNFIVWIMRLTNMAKTRKLDSGYIQLYKIICIAFSLFYLYLAGPLFLGNPSTGMRRGMFMVFVLLLVFIIYPSGKSSPKHRPSLWDVTLILLTIVSFGYWIINFEQMVLSTGIIDPITATMGVIAILLSLEATRRVLGTLLPVLAILFLLYGYLGPYMPNLLSHGGYSVMRLATEMFTQNAIFGIVLETTATYVVLFVVFGGILNRMGAGEFFVKFPYALTAGLRGGPAKAAVVASGMMGMISGSATANTVATGTFTIPLMKKAGYKPHIAGGIEPAASTGGMFMPPIMGAAVFIMAEMINVPYIEIMIVSIIPAILYFYSVGTIAHYEALKNDIKIIPKSERDNPLSVLKEGWFYLIPIALVIYLMLIGMTPSRAVFWAIISIVVVSLINRFIRKERNTSYVGILKKSGRDILDGLEEGATNSLVIGAVVGTVGIILGIVFLTGLGFIFTSSIMQLTLGLVPLALLFAFIVSYILGMGMTVTSAYILMAVLVAPALQTMGIPVLAAHLLVFWYSQTSNISPPVSMAAFAGAAIAKSDPIKTGFAALKYAMFILIIPILFVYSPLLSPEFSFSFIQTVVTLFIAVTPMATAIIGFLSRKLNIIERILLFISAILLILPNFFVSLIGLAIFLIMNIIQRIQVKNSMNEELRKSV